jgi:mRNA interferase MazF
MKHVEPGEVWVADLGMMAKIRPVLVLTPTPADNELTLVTFVVHTTELHGYAWELQIPKPWLKEGAFHLQQIQSQAIAKFEYRLGQLTSDEFELVKDRIRERLDL